MAEGLTIVNHNVRQIITDGFPVQSKSVTVIAGQELVAGQIVAVPRVGAIGAVTAVVGNTGNGTVSGSITASARAVAGVYRLTCIAITVNGGVFCVVAPNGEVAGFARVGVAFTSAHLSGFTIADGSTDFALGDSFTITVSAGSGKCVAYNANEPHEIVGVLAEDVDAALADTPATVYTAGNLLASGLTGYTSALEMPLRLLNLFVKESR